MQKDVQDAIKWESLLNAAEIGVTVKDGVVTLKGIVESYPKKTEAKQAAKNVAGVKAAVEKIEIKFCSTVEKRNNSEIAQEIVTALKWNWCVSNDKIKVTVENGWITLDGELKYNYQRDAAKESVKDLLGVTGVSNNITIKSTSEEKAEKVDIEFTLRRNWAISDNEINVSVSGYKATLSGTVDSWYQKDEAGRIAYKVPGI